MAAAYVVTAVASVPRLLDAVIVGGGPAGLSAALGLARAGRHVLVLDGGRYRNDGAHYMHNVLGADHTPPGEFREAAAQQILQRYSTIERRMDTEVQDIVLKQESNSEEQKEFPPLANVRVKATSGELIFARKVIVATGMKDLPPEPRIPGWQELWGSVIQFCPYCDGYENRDGEWAVLVRSNAVERASTPELNLPAFPTQMYAHYIATIFAFHKRLTILTHGQEASDLFTPEQLASFQAKEIRIRTERIDSLTAITDQADMVATKANGPTGVEVAFAGCAETLKLRTLYSRTSYMQSSIVRNLSLKVHPLFGTVEVDMFGHSSKQHVFVCGDASQPMPSVPNAMATGAAAAAGVNADMAGEEMFTLH